MTYIVILRFSLSKVHFNDQFLSLFLRRFLLSFRRFLLGRRFLLFGRGFSYVSSFSPESMRGVWQ